MFDFNYYLRQALSNINTKTYFNIPATTIKDCAIKAQQRTKFKPRNKQNKAKCYKKKRQKTKYTLAK